MRLIELPCGELINADAVYSVRVAVDTGERPTLVQGWQNLDEVPLRLHGEARAIATSVAGAEMTLLSVPVAIDTVAVISDCGPREKALHVMDCIGIAWRGPEVDLAIRDAKAQVRKLLEGGA